MSTRARRSFNSANPTARAVLSMPPAQQQPDPACAPGGVTISAKALMQARSFGLHPYQVAQMQRKLVAERMRAREHRFQFATRTVHYTDECGMFTITRVQ